MREGGRKGRTIAIANGSKIVVGLTVVIDRCVGCGNCQAVCPCDAMQVRGVTHLDENLCTACLICIDYCGLKALKVQYEETPI